MSKIQFTQDELNKLSNNIYIKKISNKSITYTNEFKIHFIAEYNNGKTPTQIFNEAGLSSDILGLNRIRCASERWRKSYAKDGVLGLDDTRFSNSGRPRVREQTSTPNF